jgi:hypothetical protein
MNGGQFHRSEDSMLTHRDIAWLIEKKHFLLDGEKYASGLSAWSSSPMELLL